MKFDKNTKLDMSEFKKYRKKTLVHAKQMHEAFEVVTPEGTMNGHNDDYLAIGIKGELYPIQKEIFEESYEEVALKCPKCGSKNVKKEDLPNPSNWWIVCQECRHFWLPLEDMRRRLGVKS